MSSRPATTLSTSRRSSEEVRALLLDSARELFTEQGYRATTKDIAGRAGVAESAIYTRFGSKAELFRLAVISVFTEFIDDWVSSWESRSGHGDIEEIAASYVDGLYDMARRNRRVLRALMSNPADNDPTLRDIAERISRHFANSLGRVQRVVRLGAAARGYALDEPVAIAISTAMVVSTALFDDWFLPDESRQASRERLTGELVALVVHGIAHRPAALGA
jgi:AcrR family transcriptional regulator